MLQLVAAVLLCSPQLELAESRESFELRQHAERPLAVNGELVDPEEVKLALVYAKGAALLEAVRREALLKLYAEELPSPTLSNATDSDHEYQALLDRLQCELRDRSMDATVHLLYGTEHIARRAAVAVARFDEAFFPVDPRQWPEITERMVTASSEEEFAKHVRDNFRDNLRGENSEGSHKSLLYECLREIVESGLLAETRIEFASDGLPSGIVLRARNTSGETLLELSLTEAFAAVLPALDHETIRRERQWVARRRAVEKRLRSDGLLLTPEETRTLHSHLERSFREFDWPVASKFNSFRFPSNEHLREYARLAASYDKLIGARFQPPATGVLSALASQHREKLRSVLGGASVTSRVLFFDAREPSSGRLSNASRRLAGERAVQAASEFRRRAAELETDLRGRGKLRIWNDIQERAALGPYDPDRAELCNRHSAVCRFPSRGGRSYYDFSSLAGLSHYNELQSGEALLDWVFFEQEPGTVSPPLPGADGYTLVWLIRRNAPKRELQPQLEGRRTIIDQEAARIEFARYWREAVESTEIRD